jgi:hypothetical protein
VQRASTILKEQLPGIIPKFRSDAHEFPSKLLLIIGEFTNGYLGNFTNGLCASAARRLLLDSNV